MSKNSQLANQNSTTNKNFVKGVQSELKKVIWPTREELIKNELVVITFTLIASFSIWIFDFGFEKMIHYLINR